MSPTGTDPARGPLAPASAATAATGHAMPPQAKVGALSRRIAVATVALTGGAVGIAALVLWTVAHWVLLETIDARLHGRQAHFMADRFAEHQNGHDHPPALPAGPDSRPPAITDPADQDPRACSRPVPAARNCRRCGSFCATATPAANCGGRRT